MSESIKTLFDGLSEGNFTSLSKVFSALSLSQIIPELITTLILGFLLSLVYTFASKREGTFVRSFSMTLILLPTIIATILSIAAGNIGIALGLAGTFSVVRYRSLPGDSKEIAYIFFTMAIGVTCGTGYILYSILLAIIIYAVMIILAVTNYGKSKKQDLVLKINIPENLNFSDVCDDLLNKYTDKFDLSHIKTKEFGAVYELTYYITMKKDVDQRQFIDELRCRNGNLNITLISREYAEKQVK